MENSVIIKPKESLQTKMWRWGANLFPAYRRSGARVTYIASDFKEVQIRLDNSWKTRNHLGITWGGSIYAAIDPIYGVMLYQLLKRKWLVVDKEANINFIRPSKCSLFSTFSISSQQLAEIENVLKENRKMDISFSGELVCSLGEVYATFDKLIAIRPY